MVGKNRRTVGKSRRLELATQWQVFCVPEGLRIPNPPSSMDVSDTSSLDFCTYALLERSATVILLNF